MKYWDNGSQAIKIFMTLMDTLIKDEDISQKMKPMDQLIWYDFTQDGPEFSYWIDTRNDNLICGPGEPEEKPNVAVSMSLDTGHRFYSNKINPLMAMAKGQIKLKGSATSLLKLTPLSKAIAVFYNQILEDLKFDEIKI